MWLVWLSYHSVILTSALAEISLLACQKYHSPTANITFDKVKNITASPLDLPGGDDGIRTHDPLLAGQVLSQLSYTPRLNLRILLFSIFFRVKDGIIRPYLLVSALSYLPVQSPVKYFHHCRA